MEPSVAILQNIVNIFRYCQISPSDNPGMVFASWRELFSRLSPPVNPLLASFREQNVWRKIFGEIVRNMYFEKYFEKYFDEYR